MLACNDGASLVTLASALLGKNKRLDGSSPPEGTSEMKEAPPGFEPGMKVLQTSACDAVSHCVPNPSVHINDRQSLSLPYSGQNETDLAARIAELSEEARSALIALIEIAEKRVYTDPTT